MSAWGDSWSTSWGSSWGSVGVAAGVDLGTPITNSGATQDTENRYTICQVTGFRVKPGELTTTWDGKLVRQESFDIKHEQLRVRPQAESLTGPERPEPASDTFLADNEVKANDL